MQTSDVRRDFHCRQKWTRPVRPGMSALEREPDVAGRFPAVSFRTMCRGACAGRGAGSLVRVISTAPAVRILSSLAIWTTAAANALNDCAACLRRPVLAIPGPHAMSDMTRVRNAHQGGRRLFNELKRHRAGMSGVAA
jgi:hypothetical protein